jgi:hypothetical protein
MHREVSQVLASAAESIVSADMKESIAHLWTQFLQPVLQFSPERDATTKRASQVRGIAPLDIVGTPYGVGVVESIRMAADGTPLYETLLTWCRCVLQADSVWLQSASATSKAVGKPPCAGGSSSAGASASSVPAAAAATGSSAASHSVSAESQQAGVGKVKPLLTVPSTVAAAVGGSSGWASASASVGASAGAAVTAPMELPPRIIYCSSIGYVFFRLHNILTVRPPSALTFLWVLALWCWVLGVGC